VSPLARTAVNGSGPVKPAYLMLYVGKPVRARPADGDLKWRLDCYGDR
jgi:hypothetical protein